ncbi:MAG: sugar ABC transporter ATP-binding protein [Clostridiales bacterium]|nr:sugar ABC transporter ATP-binding protein [Clostridiales bacterium]
MACLVEMKQISKSFFGVEVLTEVDFQVESGEVMALCGENGAGKSTLMKILAAVYSNDSGDIFLDGVQLDERRRTPLEMQKMGVSMIHQELNLMEHLTVAQNIFLTREPLLKVGLIDFKKMNEEAKKLLAMLGQSISPTEKVSNLRVAEKQMVEIAKAISFNVKVLIMDEPTAMLTQKETDILFDLIRRLSQEGMSIIYISHRLKEIKEVCNRVTILRDGTLVTVKNVYDVTEQAIASLMVGREVKSSIASDFLGDEDDVTVEVREVTDSFLKNVSFKARRGEIVGFSGLVGAGRSELMEFLFGIRKSEMGEVLLNGEPVTISRPEEAIKKGVGFATEDRQKTGLFLIRSIRENVNVISQVKDRSHWNNTAKRSQNTAKMIERLNIKCRSQAQMAGNLSGGNQQKIVLAKWLLVNSDILILDEPTRGIDVGAREEIYNIINGLAAEGKTIIIISSDLTEVLSICQRVIVMHEGSVKAELTQEERNEESIMRYASGASGDL